MVKEIEEELKEQNELFNLLSKYRINIGVVSEDSYRDETKLSLGITNAQLMFIHENGSPINNIPQRPVLKMTILYARQNLINHTFNNITDGIINKNWTEENIERELKILCSRMEDYARDIIYSNDGRLIPNSPIVAKRKKGNHPLFDTGQLARSITCQLQKI